MVAGAISLDAQTPYERIDQNRERVAGHYHHYETPQSQTVEYPEGYAPFYISHYGRHGCRWHTSPVIYRRPLEKLEQYDRDGVLTQEGKKLLETLTYIEKDAAGREGELTPRGVREHRGIAERMFRNYPEVFETRQGRPATVECRSTNVTRCILSMCAFNERLKELRPELQMNRTAYKRDLGYMINRKEAKSISKKANAECDSLQKAWLSPERFIRTIVKDKKYIRDNISNPEKLMFHIYQIASILQDTDYLDMDLFKYFTANELDDLWRCENAFVYLTFGPSAKYGDRIIADAKPLLYNIVETADKVISGKNGTAASLRFGHDHALVPLYALMGIKGACEKVKVEDADKVWDVSSVTPMATNLQLVFFRPADRNDPSAVKVRVLHNETDAILPIDGAPYYNWTELRTYLLQQCK